MSQSYAVPFFLIVACVAVPATASFDQLASEVQKKEELIDGDHLARPLVLQSLAVNCDINDAVKAAISGDNKMLAGTLETAQKNLRSVAERLPEIAKRKRFQKPVKQPVGTDIKTGDDALMAIAVLAGKSADAISRIRDGQGREGGQEEFSQIIRNSAEISQLILAFYAILTA